jgi:hypothetical protein
LTVSEIIPAKLWKLGVEVCPADGGADLTEPVFRSDLSFLGQAFALFPRFAWPRLLRNRGHNFGSTLNSVEPGV